MEKRCLRKRISDMFRRSSLGSTCSLSSRSTSDSVQEPIFVSSCHGHGIDKLDRSLSLPSVSTRLGRLPQPATLDHSASCRFTEDAVKKEEDSENRAPCTRPFKEWLDQGRGENGENKQNKKERTRARLLSNNGYGFTSSISIESDDDDVLFSSDENKGGGVGRRDPGARNTTLLSTRSFSSDSSEFYYSSSRASKKKKSSRHRRPKRGSKQRQRSDTGAGTDGFRPVISNICSSSSTATKAGSVSKDRVGGGEGFAVVKRSWDPYADFRRSMVEMIVAKQMFGAEQLERLLCSYLSLNSRNHHTLIIQVFSDIWEALFGN